MTFCMIVASRPPHSAGQLMAAHRPSLSRRCQARRRSMVDMSAVPPAGPAVSLSRKSGRCSSSHPRSSARNASSSGVKAKSMRADASARNLTRALVFVAVDFALSAEQEALRDTVAAALGAEAPISYVRRMIDVERGFTDELWAKVADLGWLGLLVPEAHGGLGLGLVDLAVVQEEMGKLPLPGPYFSSALFSTVAARRLELTDVLADLASGVRRGTVALEEFGHGDPVQRVRTTATRRGDSWVLDGLKPAVIDGHTADCAIVAARTDDGLGSFLV